MGAGGDIGPYAVTALRAARMSGDIGTDPLAAETRLLQCFLKLGGRTYKTALMLRHCSACRRTGFSDRRSGLHRQFPPLQDARSYGIIEKIRKRRLFYAHY